jgi:hypothetical protein
MTNIGLQLDSHLPHLLSLFFTFNLNFSGTKKCLLSHCFLGLHLTLTLVFGLKNNERSLTSLYNRLAYANTTLFSLC